MNKYQKALDRLKILISEPIQVFKTGERMILGLREVAVLQELVDKETPVKPISLKDVHGDFVGVDICRICDEHLYRGMFGNNLSDTYCSKCGTKIDWNNEEEV